MSYRQRLTKKFVAENGERIQDLSEKTIPFKSVEGVHRCINSRSANVFETYLGIFVKNGPVAGLHRPEFHSCLALGIAVSGACAVAEAHPPLPRESLRHGRFAQQCGSRRSATCLTRT